MPVITSAKTCTTLRDSIADGSILVVNLTQSAPLLHAGYVVQWAVRENGRTTLHTTGEGWNLPQGNRNFVARGEGKGCGRGRQMNIMKTLTRLVIYYLTKVVFARHCIEGLRPNYPKSLGR